MLDFILNSNAGSTKGKKIRKVLRIIEDYLQKNNIPYTVHRTNYKNHAKNLTSNLITNGATDIIGIGGDGTLHEILNGFHDFDKCNLGLIPCGTGNDFAGALGLPTKPIEALKLILNKEPVYTDYMQMPGVRGINLIGTGIDVKVLQYYANLKHKTAFGYTACLIKALFKFDFMEFDADYNGKKKHFESFIACVANGVSCGGGLKLSPDSDVGDGKLNFVAIDKVKRSKIPGMFLKLKKSKILECPGVTHELVEEIKVTGKDAGLIQVDGEIYENIPFEIKIVHNTLKMYR
ncbi:MAG: diacylglycerol kinase family lipid kinase [Clostridia bacterium]|nr:diacylglycerol kinase family lipid kinase [Clostridia bacterium]